jgi:hypothetical protein
MMKNLNEIPDKNPFRIPENYFEEVNKRIISATSGNDHKVKKIGLFSKVKPYILTAASVIGFILISYTALKLFSPGKINLLESDIMFSDSSEVYFNEIDISTLEENAAELSLSQETSEASKTDIIDYLLRENIEINDIYEQF